MERSGIVDDAYTKRSLPPVNEFGFHVLNKPYKMNLTCYLIRIYSGEKRDSSLLMKWTHIGEQISKLKIQIKLSDNALAFQFIEASAV